jgi:hypothetical protein
MVKVTYSPEVETISLDDVTLEGAGGGVLIFTFPPQPIVE